MDEESPAPQPGDRIVVRTPDRRSFYGTLIEIRAAGAAWQAVVRLDTGWVTSYPMSMVFPVDDGV